MLSVGESSEDMCKILGVVNYKETVYGRSRPIKPSNRLPLNIIHFKELELKRLETLAYFSSFLLKNLIDSLSNKKRFQ